MLDIAVRQLRQVPVKLKEENEPGLANAEILYIKTELNSLGFFLRNSFLLTKASRDFIKEYPKLIKVLKHMRGANVSYAPLLKGFPETINKNNVIPLITKYFKAPIHFDYDDLCTLIEEYQELGFQLSSVPWVQDKLEKALEAEKLKESDDEVHWIDLDVLSEDVVNFNLRDFLNKNLCSATSIRESVQQDIFKLLDTFGTKDVEFEKIKHKEIKSILLNYFWKKGDYTSFTKLITSATDWLRFFAQATNTDISLASKIKFPKFNRKQRRIILASLNELSNLEAELNTYRGLWLNLGRYIHPGEYAKRYPKTALAFKSLAEDSIVSFDSKTEQLFKSGKVKELCDHLSTRPGVFARTLHRVLRTYKNDFDYALNSFQNVAHEVQFKNLLTMISYFKSINHLDERTIVNKKGAVSIVPNLSKGCFSSNQNKKIVELLEQAAIRSVQNKFNWSGSKVSIDPCLKRILVPLQQRHVVDGLVNLDKGSRIQVDLSKVIRLFIYWKQTNQRTDLDLSLVGLDKDFNYVEHISYTRLSGHGFAHSGDITSAPNGASEFIDITPSELNHKIKYVAMQVYKYHGENFDEIISHAGWMTRSQATSNYKSYDPKTVVDKFDVNSRSAYVTPIMVDIDNQEIVLLGLNGQLTNFSYYNVENSAHNIYSILPQIANFVNTKPTLYDLAKIYVKASGAVEASEYDDNVSFRIGFNEGDIKLSDTAMVLSDLL